MSDAMGPLTFGKKEEQIFLGREIAQHQDYSEDTAIRIDQEVKRIVTDNYANARTVLTRAQATILQKIADELLGARNARRRSGAGASSPASRSNACRPPQALAARVAADAVARPQRNGPSAMVPPLPPRSRSRRNNAARGRQQASSRLGLIRPGPPPRALRSLS